MNHVTFRIDAIPRGQGRARVSSFGGFARAYKDKVDVQHETTLAALAAPHRPVVPLDCPIAVDIVAVMPRSKHLSRVSKKTGLPLADPARIPHTAKPDADNIAKGVLDALKGWWRDDAQVCDVRCTKLVAAFGEQPHYEIRVSRFEVAR
jgi:Holliday junction resolvase RusA-like endonuclease